MREAIAVLPLTSEVLPHETHSISINIFTGEIVGPVVIRHRDAAAARSQLEAERYALNGGR